MGARGRHESHDESRVAYMDGRLFRGTNDGRIIALDAKTGKQLWKTVAADRRKLIT